MATATSKVGPVNPCKWGAGGCRNLQTARKPGKPAEITRAEQGLNKKSRLRTSQSPLPAKDDVRIVLVGASFCDHPAKALAHLLQDEVCARRRARHAKKPGAVSARACCTIFSGYAFLHESRNKVKKNFSVAQFLLAYVSWRSEKTAKKTITTITTITKQSAKPNKALDSVTGLMHTRSSSKIAR